MEFCWSTIYVKNMEESVKFYQEVLGLPVKQRFTPGPDMEIAFLGEGETKVELIFDSSVKSIDLGSDISWGFRVDSLDQSMKFLKDRGIEIAAGPFEPNPNTRFIFILDPNGMKIQLVEEQRK
jgi:lactoylglutathione lyase